MRRRAFARVAELVDALDLGSSVFDVGVRVPPLVFNVHVDGTNVFFRKFSF